MSYHLTGGISALIFLFTLTGLWSQLRLVWFRKRTPTGERATAVISVNQIVSSFLAFFAFLVYGASLVRFNHYLVWSRLTACLLILWILWEMANDRQDLITGGSFISCAVLLSLTPLVLLLPSVARFARLLSTGLVVVMTFILAQGYGHQIVLMKRSGRTGAVSLRMHQWSLLKDLATIPFALCMGLRAGWPLLFLSTVSAVLKGGAIWTYCQIRKRAMNSGLEETAVSKVGVVP